MFGSLRLGGGLRREGLAPRAAGAARPQRTGSKITASAGGRPHLRRAAHQAFPPLGVDLQVVFEAGAGLCPAVALFNHLPASRFESAPREPNTLAPIHQRSSTTSMIASSVTEPARSPIANWW